MVSRFSIFLFYSLLLASCSPKLRSDIRNKQKPLSNSDVIAVVSVSDTIREEGTYIGQVSIEDNGLTMHCTYTDVITILKLNAMSSGANLIKITEHKEPDGFSSCHRIKAALYLVDNPRKFEKEFTWSKWRKLTWDDFKGLPDSATGGHIAAQTTCGFGFQTRQSFVSKAKIDAQNTFDCYKSWVRHEHKHTEGLLEHEQKHFDLSEIYSRILRKKLADPDLSVYGFSDQAYLIFKQVYGDFQKRQERYDAETAHGTDKANQQKWNKTIERELWESEQY